MPEPDRDAPVVIRKYNNRRLYNTDSASFVTLEDLHGMVRDGTGFVVEEAGTGRDITASVLIQIILDEEGRGHSTLSLGSLRQILRLADAGPHFHAYIEQCINAFVANQKQIMQSVQGVMERFGDDALQQFTETGHRNAEMFLRSMGMPVPPNADRGRGESPSAASRSEEIECLKRQLAELQRRLESLSTGQ